MVEQDGEADVPKVLQVPADAIGRLIGPNGCNLKRLVQSTGCKIEIPKDKKDEEETTVNVQLVGSDSQRRLAAFAIRDVVDGGDVEDTAARADGAMIIAHGLEHRDRESWLQWRLTAYEQEHSVRMEVGRRAVRIWSERRGGLSGQSSANVRAEANQCIEQARGLAELEVEARLDTDADNAHYDQAVLPLVQQYGVLVWVPQPEDGAIKLRVVGPTEPAKDAALLLEARYAKGKFTASVLQVAGQVQLMCAEMAADFTNDLRNLETEYSVTVKERSHILWLFGENAESVQNARGTLMQMMAWYMADSFFLLENLPKDCIDEIRADSAIRRLQAKPECAIAFDRIQGTAWICGSLREDVQKRISEIVGKWESEHWEMDLEDYGVAMWLLGPGGTGDWMKRMRNETSADIRVCPNALKVWVHGKPAIMEAGKKIVLEALERLEQKKKQDEENGGRTFKVKEVLSDVPPHMKAIMEKLQILEMMKKGGKPPEHLLKERGLVAAPTRERSRSREKTTS